MRYPKWNSYCEVKRKDGEALIINHLIEESYSLPLEMVRWGKKLDGKTNPYTIDKTINRTTVRNWLRTLDSLDCTRRRRVLLKTTGTFMYSLYIPQRITLTMRLFAWFYNKILQISFLPMFIFGIYYFSTHFNYGDGGLYLGMILGLIVGMLLHEFSHACAALACPKGKFFEIGIGISSFMPIGYALIDVKQVKNRFQRIQVNLAGVETNIFLCGLFLFLASFCGGDFYWEAFLGAAMQNGFLGLLNLIFSNGIDGANAITELLGDRTNSFISKSRELVWCRKTRKKVLDTGLNGYALVASAYIFQIFQLTIPALYIWNVLSIFEVFK